MDREDLARNKPCNSLINLDESHDFEHDIHKEPFCLVRCASNDSLFLIHKLETQTSPDAAKRIMALGFRAWNLRGDLILQCSESQQRRSLDQALSDEVVLTSSQPRRISGLRFGNNTFELAQSQVPQPTWTLQGIRRWRLFEHGPLVVGYDTASLAVIGSTLWILTEIRPQSRTAHARISRYEQAHTRFSRAIFHGFTDDSERRVKLQWIYSPDELHEATAIAHREPVLSSHFDTVSLSALCGVDDPFTETAYFFDTGLGSLVKTGQSFFPEWIRPASVHEFLRHTGVDEWTTVCGSFIGEWFLRIPNLSDFSTFTRGSVQGVVPWELLRLQVTILAPDDVVMEGAYFPGEDQGYDSDADRQYEAHVRATNFPCNLCDDRDEQATQRMDLCEQVLYLCASCGTVVTRAQQAARFVDSSQSLHRLGCEQAIETICRGLQIVF